MTALTLSSSPSSSQHPHQRRRDKRRHAGNNNSNGTSAAVSAVVTAAAAAAAKSTSKKTDSDAAAVTDSSLAEEQQQSAPPALASIQEQWEWVLHDLYNIISPSNSNNNSQQQQQQQPQMICSNPFELLRLAVRVDESWQDERILQEPLESGRLHGSSRQFLKAYFYLQHTTKTPQHLPTKKKKASTGATASVATTSTSAKRGTEQQQQQQQQLPRRDRHEITATLFDRKEFHQVPLTPIILSGLLTAIHEQRRQEEEFVERLLREQKQLQQQQQQQQQAEKQKPKKQQQQPPQEASGDTKEQDKSNNNNKDDPFLQDISSELVLFCHTLRRTAIRRIRNRQRRLQVQRIVVPTASLVILLVVYVMSISELQTTLRELHFDGCVDAAATISTLNSSTSKKEDNETMIGSSSGGSSYYKTCRMTGANLWMTYRDYLHTLTPSLQEHHDDEVPSPKRCNISTYETRASGIVYHPVSSTITNSNNRYMKDGLFSSKHGGAGNSAKEQQGHAADNHDYQDLRYPCRHPALEGRYVESPFSLHSAWKRDLITLTELNLGLQTQKAVHNKGGWFSWLSESLVHAVAWVKTVALLDLPHRERERQAKNSTFSPPHTNTKYAGGEPLHILDAGCGVGGSLYYFVPLQYAVDIQQPHSQQATPQASQSSSPPGSWQPPFSYTGITLSAAEVHFAQTLAKHHGLLLTTAKNNNATTSSSVTETVKFVQQSYDDPLPLPPIQQQQPDQTSSSEKPLNNSNNDGAPSLYNLILAIESLSYSNNLRHTVRNLLSVLRPNGIMVIADDYLDQPAVDSSPNKSSNNKQAKNMNDSSDNMEEDKDEASGFFASSWSNGNQQHQPSLVRYQDWKDILESEGCKLVYLRDLGLDYEMDFSTTPGGRRAGRANSASSASSSSSSGAPPSWDYWMTRWLWKDIAEWQLGQMDLVQLTRQRQYLYETAQASYMLMVCQKEASGSGSTIDNDDSTPNGDNKGKN